jgi:sulfate adenylyltransferase subunit 1
MDLVDYAQESFDKIKNQIDDFCTKLEVTDIRFIPISALKGDNVVHKSENMDWYQGATLMYTLENVHISGDHNHVDCRFPVQTVIRPQTEEFHDYRGYAGRIAGGVFKVGDEVTLLPSGFQSKIASINTMDGEINEAYAPMSVTICLENEMDLSRGDMIVRTNNQPENSQDVELMICWMGEKPLVPNGKYALRHTSKDARCVIKEVNYKVDINTLHRMEDDKTIGMNDIGRIKIRTTSPLFYDKYTRNRITGSIILIDEATNNTVGAGMII